MKEKFVINYQGKEFVTYPGLLDLAHERGLKSIITDLVQIPSDENGKTAIMRATVEMEGGRVFTGFGDASPANAGKVAGNALIRMAETRAKARALRDATNIGITAFEETGEDEPVQAPAKPTPIRQQVTRATVEQAAQTVKEAISQDDTDATIRRERLGTLRAEVERAGKSWDAYAEHWNSKVGSMPEFASVDQLQKAIEKVRGSK